MFWFVLFLPVVIAGITFLTAWGDNNIYISDPWRWYILFNFKPYFHLFVFTQILFISHVNYLEHRNSTWKNLHVLPIPRWTLFFSKVVYGYAMLIVNTLIFYSLVMLGGVTLGRVKPEFGFQFTSYWLEAFIPTLKFIVASVGLLAIMYWVSHRFKSIMISIVIGLIGYASAFALHLVNNRAGYDGFKYCELHPFNFPGYAFDSFGTGNHTLNMEFTGYGFICGVVILVMHYFVSRHRSIA